jgi:hypothetical protein
MKIGKGIIKRIRVNNFEITPIYDPHLGSEQCNEDLFKRVVRDIKNKKNNFTFLGGDLIECAIYGSVGAIHKQKMQIDEQVEKIIEMLMPIRDKILFGICGNHEGRMEKSTGMDLMKIICDRLQVPYQGWECYFGIKTRKGNFCTFYAHHGVGSGTTSGAKLNSLERLHFRAPLANVIMCGHNHAPINSEKEIRYMSPTGDMFSFIQHFVACGSAHESDGYASMKALGPIKTSFSKVKIRYIKGQDFAADIEKMY